ncbi:MAG: class I SAM-dependent methyltransferase [Planctomycetaceae bacterium]
MIRVLSRPLLLVACLATLSTAAVQADPRTPQRGARVPVDAELPFYSFREDHDPNGIGKFYMNREIAYVMGFGAAPWLERPQREREEQLTKMVKALQLKPGMVVADVGAGSGVISVRMARFVGAKGKVLAVDIQEEMLELLSRKLDQRKIKNVEPVLGTIRSPRLEEGTVDLAIMVDVYHEFSHPYEMMLGISRAMKPGGRVVFVEFRKEDREVPIKLVHKMSIDQVKQEMSPPEFRLRFQETIDILPWQHIIIFEKVEG